MSNRPPGGGSCAAGVTTDRPRRLPAGGRGRVRNASDPRWPGAGSGHRSGRHADLPNVHLPAGAHRRAPGLRVRQVVEPDPGGAGALPGLARRRPPRVRLRQRHGCGRRRAAPARPGRPRHPALAGLRRDVAARHLGAAGGLRRRGPGRPRRPGRRLAPGDPHGAGGVAHQPYPRHRRHRRGRPLRPRAGGRSAWSTTPSPRPTCRRHLPSGPTSSSTRPPSTSAATPTSSVGSRRATTTT